MVFEHKPRPGEPSLDRKRCKASVGHGTRVPSFHQCQRKVWKQGWCQQHHPDEVKKREDQKKQEFDRIFDRKWAIADAEAAVIRAAIKYVRESNRYMPLRTAVKRLQRARKM